MSWTSLTMIIVSGAAELRKLNPGSANNFWRCLGPNLEIGQMEKGACTKISCWVARPLENLEQGIRIWKNTDDVCLLFNSPAGAQ